MEKARQEADQRLFNLEGQFNKLGTEREQILEDYTIFIFDMETHVIDYSQPLEEHERIFRNYQAFRERVKKLIGEERMYCLLGTDKDVIDLYSSQKYHILRSLSVDEKK